MWGLLEHMLEVPTVARDVHCSHTSGGQTVYRHSPATGMAVKRPHALPTQEMEPAGSNYNRCVRTQSISAALCLCLEACVQWIALTKRDS